MTLIKQRFIRFSLSSKRTKQGVALTLAVIGLLSFASQAMAHHPSGGQAPQSFVEGFLSGIGHPVIGLDHLAFVVASGLIAAIAAGGVFIPVAFVLATLAGTVVHLMEISLPIPEVAIAASVVLFGGLLVRQNISKMAIAASAAVAGIFHGYAYGEAVVGAEIGPLFAYLVGFALIQLVIATGALAGGQLILQLRPSMMRYVGLAIAAIGFVFLTTAIG